MIPYGRQWVSAADIEACTRVLSSDFLTQGPAVDAFEQALAARVAAPFAVAVNSATSALHIAYLALGLGPGDRLWTSPITFVATSNTALLCGASVDFVDIDPATLNMCVAALERKLVEAEKTGTLPKIVVPVHFAGEPCDMPAIADLARRFGFKVVEDASHAIGARQAGQPTGACQFSDITVFSFHPVKIITTAEGGMATTRDERLYRLMRRLRSHGVTREPCELVDESDGPWSYQQLELGLNYRLTDLHAALGQSQLTRIDAFLDARHALAERYDSVLAADFRPSRRHPASFSALHLYVIRWPRGGRLDRRQAYEALRAAGIGVNVHYIPVHTQPYYRALGFDQGLCPQALDYYGQAITLPLHPQIDDAAQEHIIGTVLRLAA